LVADDIQQGVRGVKHLLQQCFDRYKVPGMVQISVTITPSGTVARAVTRGRFEGTDTGDCAAAAISQAQFKAFDGQPFTITYPVVFR
jgi:hypothetical protein